MAHDIIDTIEAAYRFELATAEWLEGIGNCFYGQLGADAGMFGCEYRIESDGRMKVGNELRISMPDAAALPLREGMEMMPMEFLRKTFARCDCATQSQYIDAELRPFIDTIMAPLARYGWRDIMAFSGVDPAGHGVYFGAWLPQPSRLTPSQRQRWTRVAVHTATALRLRRRLGGETKASERAEAVLTPAGRMEHAIGDATLGDARESLRAAVLDVETARGGLRRSDPGRAVAAWKGLVATRWTLVDQFESDGKRYLLALRNEVEVSGLAVLTDRERQVVGFAALGQTNKLIAYELGISASTVAVLLHRAARKLGVPSRKELIDAYLAATKKEP